MYTANTMAAAAEAFGMSLPGSASPPAVDRRRDGYRMRLRPGRGHHAGAAASRQGDVLTREAFENAIAVVMALGGSTNAVLHLLAIASEAEVELSSTTSTGSVTGCRIWPTSSRSAARDVRRRPVRRSSRCDEGVAGRGPAARRLPTVTGRTVAENLAETQLRPTRTAQIIRALCPNRSTPPAAWPSCAAASPPRAPW